MGTMLLRSLVFALGVVAASLALDLALTVLYQGDGAQGWGRQFFVFRMALHGAIGYSRTVPLERYYRDARAYCLHFGNNDAQRDNIARALLS